uniref:Pre-mRNA splicing Prp18-interacting factor n=1 Tax=Tanacetum cinerariifolium TaxID=118510 RepID=A0A6L2MZA4_TANCI|nr:hypothetical protein [Tanacetum cinerariifolium]
MASFDYRLNPLYPIKECSSCGALYTTDYCCSEGSLMDKIIYDLNKTPDLFQEPPQNCHKCGNPVDGHYCQGYASEPSNNNTNIVNALQEPFVVKQDPESDEFIKSSVENLVPIPSESEGIPDNVCDVPFHENSPPLDISKDQFEDFSDSNDDSTSIDDDSFSINNIESDFYEFIEELTHIISPLEYDCFSFKNEPNVGDFTMDVVEDIFPTKEPRVHVHNVLPTRPTLQLNLDFILSSESFFAYIVWIFLPFLS